MHTSAVMTRFRRLYQEKSQRHFNDEWGIEGINDGVDQLDAEIAEIHPEFMGALSRNLSFGANQQEYTLDATVSEIVTVEITDQGGPPYRRLLPADFRDRSGPFAPMAWADWMGSAGGKGEPSHYYVRGTQPASDPPVLGFIPIPTRTAMNNVLYWFHGTRNLVTAIDTVQIPDLPVLWHPLLAWHLCVLAAGSDERSVLNYFVGMFNSRLELRKAAAIRGQAEYQYEEFAVVE